MEVTGETGEQDPTFGTGDEIAQSFAYGDLRLDVAGSLGVRAVDEQQPNSPPAESGEHLEVGGHAVDRGRIEFEVPGMDDQALGGLEGDAGRLRDAVRHRDVGPAEGTMFHPHAGFGRAEIGFDPELGDPGPHQFERERASVDGHAHLPQQVAERANVVFVTMGQDHAFERAVPFEG